MVKVSPLNEAPAASLRVRLGDALGQLNRVILGKEAEIRLCLACLLARGHLLIEDIPGVGKTTLAHALAQTLGLSYQRVQFTSDLLPADIIGVSIFDRAANRFEFQHGPIFAQLVLADEVNRATPKAQSALLEAMEEQQVTVDGRSYALPEPFFVVATQNPIDQVGTFPLPESQLDRFLMRIELGYPDAAHERQLLMGQDRRDLLATLGSILEPSDLAELQNAVTQVHASPALLDYVQALVSFTRASGRFACGLSPRAAIGLLHASQSWALIEGRSSVLPEDVQAVLPPLVGHRLRLTGEATAASSLATGRRIIESVPIP
jgi:MoxR-like ATPase